MYMSMHAIAYKTQLLKDIGYVQSEGILYTDQEWIFLPMSNVTSFMYFDKSLYLYLVERDGQSVDPNVRKKNLWMEIDIVKKQIKDYKERINNPNLKNKQYMDDKLFQRCLDMYQFHLIKYRKNIDINPLIEFDKFLKKELPIIYEKLNSLELTRLKIKYIKNWRKSFSNAGLGFRFFYRVYDIQESGLSHALKQLILKPIKYILKKLGLFDTVKRIVKGKNGD